MPSGWAMTECFWETTCSKRGGRARYSRPKRCEWSSPACPNPLGTNGSGRPCWKVQAPSCSWHRFLGWLSSVLCCTVCCVPCRRRGPL